LEKSSLCNQLLSTSSTFVVSKAAKRENVIHFGFIGPHHQSSHLWTVITMAEKIDVFDS